VGVHRGVRRLPLREAAQLLGVSKDAVRQRIRRGTIRSEKGEDGRVYVYVDASLNAAHPQADHAGHAYFQAEGAQQHADSAPLVEELRDQVGYLREQLRREQDAHAEARRIIAALTSRIPEIEPPRSPVEHLEDQEALRDEAGMEGRDPEDRQSWHFHRYRAPRGETPSEAPGSPADEQQGRGPVPDTGGSQEGAERPQERRSFWSRVFGA
jgi:hypothetical protein